MIVSWWPGLRLPLGELCPRAWLNICLYCVVKSTFIVWKRMSCLATVFIWPTKYVAQSSIYELRFQCIDIQASHYVFSRAFSLLDDFTCQSTLRYFLRGKIHNLMALSCFYIYLHFAFTYTVLLTKPNGRSESPFLMKISGCWIACGWARVQRATKPFPSV